MSGNDHIRDKFIHQIGELAGGVGLSRSVGQIYALLYMSEDPVSLSDIAEACSMSKGTASTSVRELLRWDAVRKVAVPGGRADYYEPNRDVTGVVLERLRQGMQRRLGIMDRALDEAAGELEKDEHDNSASYKKRLAEIEEMTTTFKSLIDNMEILYHSASRLLKDS